MRSASPLTRLVSGSLNRASTRRRTPGNVGYEEGGQLTEKVRRRPDSVGLFDELEKAHGDVFNMLLQIMEEGSLNDSFGRVVDCRNTVIVLTTNVGASQANEAGTLGFETTESTTQDYATKATKAEITPRRWL